MTNRGKNKIEISPEYAAGWRYVEFLKETGPQQTPPWQFDLTKCIPAEEHRTLASNGVIVYNTIAYWLGYNDSIFFDIDKYNPHKTIWLTRNNINDVSIISMGIQRKG